MKRYIFVTFDIHMMGGCQNYLAGKTEYLINDGWDVFVLYSGNNNSKSYPFQQLKRFEKGNIVLLRYLPAELPSIIIKKTFLQIDNAVQESNKYDCTIIESHDDKTCLWGELLAIRYSAKHINFNCNELFRGNNKYYEEYIDLFYYKYLRRELFAISKQAMCNLFSGYYNVEVSDKDVFVAACPSSVQDCSDSRVDSIGDADWSIAYIGRIQKNYVDIVIHDISVFANKHSDKRINLVFVGDTASKKDYINHLFNSLKNVTVYHLGDMVPIPRKLYSKLDVVIAGSGCADCSAKEGVPVIVPDPQSMMSNGVLGYETQSILFYDGKSVQSSYDDALNRVLVENICDKMAYTYSGSIDASFCYNQQMKIAENTDCATEYFSRKKIVKSNGRSLLRIKNCIYLTIKMIVKKYDK